MSEGTAGARRLHPISLVSGSLKSLPGAIIGMIGAFSVLVRENPGLAVLIAFGMLLLILGSAALRWWRFTYEVSGREIVIESGLFSRQRRVIPFDRVRDIAIERPVLARLVGTAKARVETGGGKSDEGVLDMIELEEAQELRDLIRRSNLVTAAAGADGDPAHAAPAAEPAEPVIFAMGLDRVLGSGLLNFSLIFIAVAFGALQYLEDLGIVDLETLARSPEAEAYAGMFTIRTGLIILLLLLLLGLASGVVRTLARDFRFRLTAGEAGLRRRRGLLTLSEVLIPARRTEAALIEVGLIGGWLGWQSLAFQTLGADPKEGGVQQAAPFARPEEVERILTTAGFPLPPVEPLVRPPARALVRRCGPWLLLAGAAAAAGSIRPEAFWGVPVLLLVAAAGFLSWWRAGHLFAPDVLYIQSGIVGRRLWILPHEKLQILETSRTPLQRALGLASLHPDTAGAALFGAPEVEDLFDRDEAPLRERLLASFYAGRARVRQAAAMRPVPAVTER